MNIPDDKITKYPKDNAMIINDSRVFKGILIAAKTWGSNCLNETNAGATEDLDELMVEFAAKLEDLRAKYEVSGDTLNGRASIENRYYDELNVLLTKYRALLFDAALDYVSDDTAIDLMTELLEDED